jgi:hypothetical protein
MYQFFCGAMAKKTALLQTKALACVSGLANVLFCAWAVHLFVFLFLSLSSKLSAVSLSFYTCCQRKIIAVVAGFTALSVQFSTSVRKKHQSFKVAQKPAIIGYYMLCKFIHFFIYQFNMRTKFCCQII